jgi:hypothetical protein
LGVAFPNATITISEQPTNIQNVVFDPALTAVSGQTRADGTNDVTFDIIGTGDNISATYDGSITFSVGSTTFDFSPSFTCPSP